LEISFRSSQEILTAVDATFSTPSFSKEFISEDEKMKHHAAQTYQGHVSIFPIIEKEKKEKTTHLRQSVNLLKEENTKTKLVNSVVNEIKKLVENPPYLDSQKRQLIPADILILLKKRQPFAPLLLAALKAENIPVEELDRFQLLDDLAVKDLISCAKFTLFPQDDLNTAGLLKSPLLQIDEATLFELCHKRGKEKTLFERVCENKSLTKQAEFLNALIDKSMLNVFEFYSFILETQDGRYRLVSEMGESYQESIQSFFDLAFDYHKKAGASLRNFLHYLLVSNPSIKRTFSSNAQGIKIMSTHGSKGLESPVVILPDTIHSEKGSKTKFFFDSDGVPFTTAYTKNTNTFLDNLKTTEQTQQNAESARLLYVAMTRAKEILFIFGIGKEKEGSWYSAIKEGLISLHAKENDGHISYGKDLLYSPKIFSQKTAIKESKRQLLIKDLPETLEPEFPKNNSAEADEGTFIHAILSALPLIEKIKRKDFIKKRLNIAPFSQEKKEDWQHNLERLLVPEFNYLFSPTNLPESEIITPTGQILRIDSLCFRENEIWIIDYKTDLKTDLIPPIYEKQLKNYKKHVRNIDQNKIIRCFIFWLRTSKLKELK
ncbi:MAG: 3'-5' exonuclease, partial [Alphaproteobacteria bacterium]